MCARNFFNTFAQNPANSCSTATLLSTCILYWIARKLQPGTSPHCVANQHVSLLTQKITMQILFTFALPFETTSTLVCCSLLRQLLAAVAAAPELILLSNTTTIENYHWGGGIDWRMHHPCRDHVLITLLQVRYAPWHQPQPAVARFEVGELQAPLGPLFRWWRVIARGVPFCCWKR